MIISSATRRVLLGLVPALTLAACSPQPASPPALILTLQGSTTQNPDSSSAGSTVAVQLYELTATTKFNATDITSLISDETATLGTSEAGASEQLLLTPGQTLTISRPLKPHVVAIGLAILFRDINHATWRIIAPVAATGPSRVTVDIAGLTATLRGAGGG
jgi:type VI secretion system protein VasD